MPAFCFREFRNQQKPLIHFVENIQEKISFTLNQLDLFKQSVVNLLYTIFGIVFERENKNHNNHDE